MCYLLFLLTKIKKERTPNLETGGHAHSPRRNYKTWREKERECVCPDGLRLPAHRSVSGLFRCLQPQTWKCSNMNQVQTVSEILGTRQARWCWPAPVISAARETETGDSFDFRSSNLGGPWMSTLHSAAMDKQWTSLLNGSHRLPREGWTGWNPQDQKCFCYGLSVYTWRNALSMALIIKHKIHLFSLYSS